jgi:hypothetical protein
MANPVTVACPSGVWTKVATAVTSARIYYGPDGTQDTADAFRMTYRQTGAAAPVADAGVGLPLSDRDEAETSYRAEHGESVDIYIKPIGGSGTVTVHAPFGGPLGAGRQVHESFQIGAVTETLRLVRAMSTGRIIGVSAETGTAAAAAESMTFDVEIYPPGGPGVSCLTGVITINNAIAIDTPVAGVVNVAASAYAAGDLIRVVRTYVPGGAPTPMRDTVVTVATSP